MSLKYQNIPSQEALILTISQDAKNLAHYYQSLLKQHTKRKKFSKQWLAAQQLSAQRILNECNGDFMYSGNAIRYALFGTRLPSIRKKANMSLYHLYGYWKHIVKDYTKCLLEQAAMQAALPKAA